MENLGIDTKLIIAQLVNFAIFFFVFQKFISKPFLSYLKKKREEEELRESFAARLETREAELAEEDKKVARERKKILDKAITEGKEEAEKVKAQIIADSKKEAERVLSQGREQLSAEREELYKEVRKQIASISMLVVGKALREYLTDDAQKKITQNIIKHIPSDVKLEH
jgi:F-type H+-transporting ATPase subunit b